MMAATANLSIGPFVTTMTSKRMPIIAAFGLLIGIPLLIALPKLRELRWRDTQTTTLDPTKQTAEWIDQEAAIQEAEAIDSSRYDRELGIRYIPRLPSGNIELEAAFRQRRTDACEPVPAEQATLLRQLTTSLTLRDAKRKNLTQLPATRRPIATVGLKMLDLDIAELPTLSRGEILEFTEAHFVSLQARILQDTATKEWLVHHRPIAAIAKYKLPSLTQNFVEPITSTIDQIRGLGIVRSDFSETPDKSIIAWLFRSDWIQPGTNFTLPRYEFILVQATREPNAELGEPFSWQVILTTENREQMHYIRERYIANIPKRTADSTVVATVKIMKFESDGLRPKSSANRDVALQHVQSYPTAAVAAKLAESGVQDWHEAPDALFKLFAEGVVMDLDSPIESSDD